MISGPGLSHCCPAPMVAVVDHLGATGRLWRPSSTGIAVVWPGGTCRRSSALCRRFGRGTDGLPPMVPGIESTPGSLQRLMPQVRSTGWCRWTRPSTGPTNTERTFSGPQGGLPNYKKLIAEPSDHAIGRSRGGLSTKLHHACDGRGRPLAMMVGPGQAGDSPMFPVVMEALRVPRLGGGPWATKRIRPGQTDRCCLTERSRPSFLNRPTRRGTANAAVHGAAAP
jgi:hypothetical protein